MIEPAKNRLKEIRKVKGLTMEQVYLGICSKRHYIRLEKNECEINITYLCHFSNRLGVSIEKLIKEPSRYQSFSNILKEIY